MTSFKHFSLPSQQMEVMLAGHFVAECLHVVAVFGVPDLIAKGSTTIKTIAAATGCHEFSLYRLLRTLASIGVFTESYPGPVPINVPRRNVAKRCCQFSA